MQISVTPHTYRRIANIAGFLGTTTDSQVNDALEEWLDTVGHCLIVSAELGHKPKRRKISKVAPFTARRVV